MQLTSIMELTHRGSMAVSIAQITSIVELTFTAITVIAIPVISNAIVIPVISNAITRIAINVIAAKVDPIPAKLVWSSRYG